jgi:hypothetical protein
MKFEEVWKMATKGPFTIIGGNTIMAPTGWKADLDPWFLGASETVHIASTNENHKPHDEQKANAQLFVHCATVLKPLMDSLVVLKQLEWSLPGESMSYCPSCRSGIKYGHTDHCALALAIRELDKANEVEV